MTSLDYISNKLKSLISLFPEIRARYDYDVLSNTHSIEVVPNQLYHLNNQFNDWQNDIILEFIDLFPSESVCFLTDDSLIGIENFQLEFEGLAFNKPSIRIYQYFEVNYSYVEKIEELLSTHEPLIHLVDHFEGKIKIIHNVKRGPNPRCFLRGSLSSNTFHEVVNNIIDYAKSEPTKYQVIEDNNTVAA